MIIDEILDRRNGRRFVPDEFKRYVLEESAIFGFKYFAEAYIKSNDIDKEYPSTRPNRNISFISPPPILSLLNSLSPSNFIIYMVAKAKTADSTFSAVKVNP